MSTTTNIRDCRTLYTDPQLRLPCYRLVRDFESHLPDGTAVRVAEYAPTVGRYSARRVQVYTVDPNGRRAFLFDTDDCHDQGNAIFALDQWTNSLPRAAAQPQEAA